MSKSLLGHLLLAGLVLAAAVHAQSKRPRWSYRIVAQYHQGSVTTLDTTEDGGIVVTGSPDHTVAVWIEGRIRHLLQGRFGLLSADGTRVIAVTAWPDASNVVDVHDARTGRGVASFRIHDVITALAVHPDGEHLLTCCAGGEIRIWKMEDGELIRTLTGHAAHPLDPSSLSSELEISDDGRRVVRQAGAGILVWDLPGGELRSPLTLAGHIPRLLDVAPCGQIAVSSSHESHDLVVWDLSGRRPPRVLAGHTDRVDALAVSDDGRRSLSAARDGTLRLWDLESGATLANLTFEEPVFVLALSADGLHIYASTRKGDAVLFDTQAATSQRLRTPQVILARFSSGPLLHVAQTSGVFTFDGITGALLRGDPIPPIRMDRVGFGPDGRTIIAAQGTFLRLWHLDSGRVSTLAGSDFVFSPDGARLVAGPVEGRFHLWSVRDRMLLAELAHEAPITAFALSEDGAFLATGADDGSLRVWDAVEGRPVATQPATGTETRRIDWFPGTYLLDATDAAGRNVRWELLADELREVAKAQTEGSVSAPALDSNHPILPDSYRASILALAVSPDGRSLLTGGADGAARVWNATTGYLHCTVYGTGPLTAVAWSRNGRYMAAGGPSGMISIWDSFSWCSERLFRLYSGKKSEWAVLSEHGHWDAAKRGDLDGLTFWWNDQPYPLTTFSRVFEPGLLSNLRTARLRSLDR